MLVLTRKKGESIVISENIEIIILGVEGDNVKIGVNAPKHIEIHRKELYLAIQQSNEEASSGRDELLRKISEWKKK
ncbi:MULTISPECIES: carbon storage regulator CsrA [unclassified Paenibacillus]|uniref:carbon storage regulator CsrA n=1 Tax=unclassified Paenibacillus TaxID=185978 RepID=UPI0011A17C3C|nr:MULTISPECIES: carbon storage regulator CsrA [unclassified Paenibacillus]UYO05200.1 carbon storage regulator CsrA [Paenibacillus sp. PSB04]